MKTNILKSIFIIAISAGLLSICVNDDDYGTPNLDLLNCEIAANITVTKTPQEIMAIATAANGSPVKYTADDIIEAYVVSSDKGGNFFKTIHFQTEDKSFAFSASVDLANYANFYQVGRKAYIKLKDRYIQLKDGGLLIGELDGNSVFRIPAPLVVPTIPRSCDAPISEDGMITKLTITEALASNVHLNKLIEFDAVQFAASAVGKPYHIVANGNSGTNHLITDQTGKTIIVRSGSFSKYAVKIVPEKSGTIRGVLTRFGTTYQFTPRYESDIMLNNERFYVNTQLGGTDVQYLGARTENFESYPTTSPNNRVFPLYVNDSYVGNRYWEVKTNNNNKHLEMTAFGGTPGTYVSLFYVPVNMTTANTFSFKTRDGFNNGAVLKVYYTTNYTPGTDVASATLIDITNQFTISNTPSGFGSTFINSGIFNIPVTVTGNGFFVFEYSGTSIAPTRTTTMQIDDIAIN